jgi:hypothetical protein
MAWQQCTVANLKLIHSKLCSSCNTLKRVWTLEADWQCDKRGDRVISHLQSSKLPCQLQTFLQAFCSNFQWLLAAHNGKFLQSLVASSLSCPLLPVTLSLMYVAADLFALSHNSVHCNSTALYFKFNNLKYSVHKIYILIYSIFTWHCVCMHVFIL